MHFGLSFTRIMYTKTLILFLLLIVMVFIWTTQIPLYSVLSIEREDSGKVLAYGYQNQMKQFQIHYIHSIHKSPVIESYEIQDQQIVQQQITYDEFAVGMPSNVEGEGKFIEKDGHYMITDMNRVFPYLDIRIAQVMPDHGLLIENHLIPFATISKPGSWIRIKVRKVSLWQKMKGVDLLERTKSN